MRFFHNYRLALIALCLWTLNAVAAVDTHRLFVPLSDAMSAAKVGDSAQVQTHLAQLSAYFTSLDEEQQRSSAGLQVQTALKTAEQQLQIGDLENLSKALYAFEKEQNPIDYAQKRAKFAQRVLPVHQQLHDAVVAQDLALVQALYKKFNSTWTLNEKVVRETSLGHYGQIETAMSFLRIAMLAEPADFAGMQTQSTRLGEALADFIAGNTVEVEKIAGAPETLSDGIALLKESQQAIANANLSQASEQLALFIRQWPIFEGDVRTRDGALYTRVESELPMILAKPESAENQAKLASLLQALDAIDVSANYSAIDAMLVLLREGVEALLIVMALLAALHAAKQNRAKYWVYGGAAVGIALSIVAALALQALFPAVSAGSHREILEGAVGIVAVVMMIFVGAWLHGKSSLAGWQRFVQTQLNTALAKGSLFSLGLLSFLAVFREGAETLLFYAAMLPRMTTQSLALGVLSALVLLCFIAAAIHISSHRLPIHRLFALMTALIYLLGFKILGVSVHALQLTDVLPIHIIEKMPAFPVIGFYASWEGLLAQALYLMLIPIVQKLLTGRAKSS